MIVGWYIYNIYPCLSLLCCVFKKQSFILVSLPETPKTHNDFFQKCNLLVTLASGQFINSCEVMYSQKQMFPPTKQKTNVYGRYPIRSILSSLGR